MRPAVRLTRRPGGGFRLEGAGEAPIEGVPDGAGFALSGGVPSRLDWVDAERGWLLTDGAAASAGELGRTTAERLDPVLAPSSVLLADGRLFRLAMIGASDPRIELGRWDVPGAYAVGHAKDGAWELDRTAAGTALDAPAALWVLTCVEIGRLDGWYGTGGGVP